MNKILSTLSVMLILASNSLALTQGSEEVRLSGNLDFDSPDGTKISLGGGYGQFIANYVEVGGEGRFETDDYVTTIAAGGFGEFNFETETPFIPFVGLRLGLVSTTIDSANSEFGVEISPYGGAKYFISQNIAIGGRLNIRLSSGEVYVNSSMAGETTDFSVDFGLNYYF